MTKPRARTILSIITVVGYILITGGFFAVLFLGDKIGVPEGNLSTQFMGMFGIVIGNWGALMLMVYTFNFGTSRGSQDKGETQNEILKQLGKG
jgi:hypothetical protein